MKAAIKSGESRLCWALHPSSAVIQLIAGLLICTNGGGDGNARQKTILSKSDMVNQLKNKVRLALVTHPIQYQAPLWWRISQELYTDLTVLFAQDFSVRIAKIRDLRA